MHLPFSVLPPTILENGTIVVPLSPKSTRACEALGFDREKKELLIVLGSLFRLVTDLQSFVPRVS